MTIDLGIDDFKFRKPLHSLSSYCSLTFWQILSPIVAICPFCGQLARLARLLSLLLVKAGAKAKAIK